MKALTIWQPFAWAVLEGGKRIENRSWRPPGAMLGRLFAVHAGAKMWGELPGWVAAPDHFVRGAILGVARLVDVVGTRKEAVAAVGELGARWYTGEIGFVLEEPVMLPRPVPCRGMLGFWELPQLIEIEVRRQLEERHRA